jgi:uncharacterized membrane protein
VSGVTISMRRRLPTGETRPWTFKEIVQGKPIGHPSHPMFVHFPVAFYFAVLGLDILSKLGDFPSAPLATVWLLIGAFSATVFAVTTGLVDRSTTTRGSQARKRVNRHALYQVATATVFVVNFVIRWPDRHLAEATTTWILLDVLGCLILLVGQYLGGLLVYQLGFRVGSED